MTFWSSYIYTGLEGRTLSILSSTFLKRKCKCPSFPPNDLERNHVRPSFLNAAIFASAVNSPIVGIRSLGDLGAPHFFLPGDGPWTLSATAAVSRGELTVLEPPAPSQEALRFSLPRTLAAWEATVLTLVLRPSRPSFCSSLSISPVTNLENTIEFYNRRNTMELAFWILAKLKKEGDHSHRTMKSGYK